MDGIIELLRNPETWVSLATLAALEIVLGIDNLVFITILSGKLPPEQRLKARRLGLMLALISRIALLATISWIAKLTRPLFGSTWGFLPTLPGHEPGISGRDLILLIGGLFLIAKATFEIYDKVEAKQHAEEAVAARSAATKFGGILIQIMLLDIVFSLDSVITAVGMVKHLSIMVTAVMIAIAVMVIFAGAVGDFVERHPSVKILALSFLVMIGVMLIAEGTHHHFPKGYVYFSMFFSLGIEVLNMRYRQRQDRLIDARSRAVLTEGGAGAGGGAEAHAG